MYQTYVGRCFWVDIDDGERAEVGGDLPRGEGEIAGQHVGIFDHRREGVAAVAVLGGNGRPVFG